MAFLWPRRRNLPDSETTSQTIKSVSAPPEAKVCPLCRNGKENQIISTLINRFVGMMAQFDTKCNWLETSPVDVEIGWGVVFPTFEFVRIVFCQRTLSKQRAVTSPLWPLKVALTDFVSKSHRVIEPSEPLHKKNENLNGAMDEKLNLKAVGKETKIGRGKSILLVHESRPGTSI